jgi:hypothetical protein
MALGFQVKESLKEAESNLRNALAFAARSERPLVATSIAKMIQEIDSLTTIDSIMDKLEDRELGDNGKFGPFFNEE